MPRRVVPCQPRLLFSHFFELFGECTVAEIYITYRGIFPNLDVPCGVVRGHAQPPTPTLKAILFSWVLPSPKIKGAGRGRVQQQQQKSAATAAAAAAAAARQGLNEINTAMTLNRFLTCGIVVF
jgi:hypothetical protein